MRSVPRRSVHGFSWHPDAASWTRCFTDTLIFASVLFSRRTKGQRLATASISRPAGSIGAYGQLQLKRQQRTHNRFHWACSLSR